MDTPNCRCELRHVLKPKPVTVWARFRWQLRMAIAEKVLDFWLWLAGDHVPPATLKAFLDFNIGLPREPKGLVRQPDPVACKPQESVPILPSQHSDPV